MCQRGILRILNNKKQKSYFLRAMKYTPAFKAVFLLLLISFLSIDHSAFAQQLERTMRGRVVDLYTKKPIESAHVVNMNTLKGANSDDNGFFYLQAALGDSLYISFVGYKSQTFYVSDNMLNRQYTPFYIIPAVYELDQVVIHGNYLSGILEVDVRALDPVFSDNIVSLANLKTSEQIDKNAARRLNPFNPVEFVNHFFSNDKKIRKMMEEDKVASMLAERYDRDFLKKSLGLTQEEIDELLIFCRQDPKWVLHASDLDLLQALMKCKEEMDAKAKAKAAGQK